ncbi:MAG: hypothetical protein IID45_10265, partial [Planctomycetes bacterium]|nr:hypothetical protein [Planctomycetota bacterium]
MTEHFIHVRFWPGFSSKFPTERFNSILDDGELDAALDEHARELLRTHEKDFIAVAKVRLRRWRKEQEEGQQKEKERQKKWDQQDSSTGVRPKWGKTAVIKRSPKESAPSRRRNHPLIMRVCDWLGQARIWYDDGPCVSPLLWCLRRDSEDAAKLLVQALNYESENASGAIGLIRPQFGFVSAEGLSSAERIRIRLEIPKFIDNAMRAVGTEGSAAVGDLILRVIPAIVTELGTAQDVPQSPATSAEPQQDDEQQPPQVDQGATAEPPSSGAAGVADPPAENATDLNTIEKTIPPIDEPIEDWISNKALAKLLNI